MLFRNISKKSFSSGFTLIEILVVVAVTVVLSSVALTYGNSARQQTAIAVEQAKITNLILRAKSLSIATYNEIAPPPPCGYGMRVNYPNSYSLFSFDLSLDEKRRGRCASIATLSVPPAANCNAAVLPYRCYREIEVHDLDPSVGFDALPPDAIEAVFFRPPDPAVMLFPNPATNPAFKKIYMKTADGLTSRTITVNSVGQLSF